MKSLTRLQTKTEIAERLKYSIFSGDLKPGQELTQESVAEQLKISRMPVREAFQQLECEGVVLRLPNRHLLVAEFSPEKVHQTFMVLADIEASLLMLLQEQDGLSSMKNMLEQYQSAVESRSQNIFSAEMDLHKAISDSLKNMPLRQTHHRLLTGYFAYALYRCAAYSEHIKQMQSLITGLSVCQNEADLRKALRDYYNNVEELLAGQ